MKTIVLVEGVSDELALTLAARRAGRDLEAEGVSILAINGAHAMGRVLRRLAAEMPGAVLAGLYDVGEERVVRTALEVAGKDGSGFFACDADLEAELIRAVGAERLAVIIESQGDAAPWHTFQRQKQWQGRPLDQQFHRFIRSVSSRGARYIRAIIENLDPAELPRPLRLLLDFVG